MKIKTAYIRADRFEKFDEYVNGLILNGWILKKREYYHPNVESHVGMLYAELEKYDEDELERTPADERLAVRLEPDTAYICEIKRGTKDIDEFVNMVIPLGILLVDKFQGRVDEAINSLIYGEFHDAEEAEEDEV